MVAWFEDLHAGPIVSVSFLHASLGTTYNPKDGACVCVCGGGRVCFCLFVCVR